MADAESISRNFKKLKAEFLKITKRVLKTKISTNPIKLKEYEDELIVAYNNIATFFNSIFSTLTGESQTHARKEQKQIRTKILLCFVKLNCSIRLPIDIFAEIDPENISEEGTLTESEGELETTAVETSEDIDNNISKPNSIENISEFSSMAPPNGNGTAGAEEMSRIDFIRFAAQTISRNFAGDPLALNAFINAIKLVKTISNGRFDDLLKSFILTKLEGKALECVNQEGTIDGFMNDLKETIEPDNSKVVAGRMLSMKLGKISTEEYSKKAEDLAEALQRSLIVEGINQSKAKEMAIEKTVEMCRQSAKSEITIRKT